MNDSEEIETLDFESNEKVSSEIDEMLDFIDLSDDKKKDDNNDLTKLLDNSNDVDGKVEIDASSEKLEEYKPSIKDFNIKSAKTRKIVKKSMLYVIIVILLGFEFFINKTGEILNDLKVYASDNQPIKIVQNNKYGFIDYTGNKIVNPKYSYADDFVKGYAIVKNSSNLPLIIDKGGKEVYPSGTYFSIYRAGDDIIASKITKKGLKYGILNPDLRIKTDFKYDFISYIGSVYTFKNDNTVGVINSDGKEIYKYKLTDDDEKKIDVEVSNLTDPKEVSYAVVKVNSSSQIINTKDGTIVTKPTLNEISVEDNNVFYENEDAQKKYMYVYNNKVIVESVDYLSLKIDSIASGVLKAYTLSYKYEFISTKTLEQLSENLNYEQTYSGQNVFMYTTYDYKKNKNVISLVKNGEVYKVIEDDFSIEKPFNNGIAIVKYQDGTFGYLNEDGDLISNDHFLEVSEFDLYGDAIAKTQNGYGVINKNGKVIIKFENDDIKMASGIVKQKNANDSNVFYAVKKDNRYLLYNSNGKKASKTFYNDVLFNDKYPVFKAATDMNDMIIISNGLKTINLTSFNTDYEAHENHIVIKNEYYNYNGKLIYTYNGKTDGE